MDEKFTLKLKNWLDTPADGRDYALGATMLLQLSGNKIEYRNLSFAPERRADYIEQRIRKYYNFRVADLTHKQVALMQARVDDIIKSSTSYTEDNPAEKFAKGRRADHDKLPPEIQKLYADNLDILHRMRDIQTRLRIMSTEDATCPDSERYPFLKEFIALDKQMHGNWDLYDHYLAPSERQQNAAVDADTRRMQRKAYAFINLNKKRYAESKSPDLRLKLEDAYNSIPYPPQHLTDELALIGVITGKRGS